MKTIHKKNTTFLNLAATALMVAALVLGCKQNVNNGGEVQPEKFTVTFNVNGGNGDLTATVDGKTITSPAQVEKGKNVAFTATPNKKYAVDKWSITPSNALIENGKAEDTTAKVKITENTTVNVTFKSIGVQPPTPPVTDGCTVTMSAGANGSITANPVIPAGGKVAKDAEITFTATANTGYRVDTWAITGGAIQAGGQQGDTTAKVKVTENTTVNVTFKAIKYPVTMTHGEHGDITADMSIPAEGIDYGTEITFTATANTGYRVDTWTVTPTEALIENGKAEDATAKVKITENTIVNVTFKPIVYTPVAYADLDAYLAAPPESDGIDYIEVTGLTASDVYGNLYRASPLGRILKENETKKVALKFGTMPNVTYMIGCFKGCTSLVQVSDIPESVEDIHYCFDGCTELEQVSKIPNSVKDMSYCFRGCTKLEQVSNIPNSVTDMSYCFNGCTSLTSVPNIPDSVTNMKECFKGCTKLERVPNIPDSVTDMNGCFAACTKLERVPNIPDGVKDMKYCFAGCTNLERVPNIPNDVTDMGYCFEGCTSLTSVPNIPDGVKNMIGCFYGCTKLERVPNLPNSVTYMASCFYGCIKLEHVPNIPNSVTDMRWCFFGCTSLTSVTLKCEYLDGRFGDAFSGCSGLSAGRIKVPADSLDDYKDNADKMDAQKDWFAKDE